jgi:hypothetical protein
VRLYCSLCKTYGNHYSSECPTPLGMTNPTRYVCPKCGHALKFYMVMHKPETPCACFCGSAECGQNNENGFGTNAREAFADWKNKNEQPELAPRNT